MKFFFKSDQKNLWINVNESIIFIYLMCVLLNVNESTIFIYLMRVLLSKDHLFQNLYKLFEGTDYNYSIINIHI